VETRGCASLRRADAGLIPAGPVRLWVNRECSETLLLSFEVYDTPVEKHSAEVADLATEAHDALQAQDGVRGERFLKDALAREPDAPDLLNNLAAAYGLQGRREEAHALLRQVHAKHPDYWFGRIGVARLAIEAGQLDEAQALLRPMLEQKRLHTSEFAALAMAEIDLQLARGETQGAQSWLKLWESIAPDHPALAGQRRRIGTAGRFAWLTRRRP
jgi:predicted Zn-dependent protease